MNDWLAEIERYQLRLGELESRVRAGDLDALQALEAARAELNTLLSAGSQSAGEPVEHELLDSITDGVFALGRDWQFIYINRRAAANVGRTPAQLLDKNIWAEFPQFAGSEMDQVFHQVMAGRAPANFELAGTDGRFYDVSVYPAASGISVYWLEKTQQKRAEAQRDASIEHLGHLVEASATILACNTIAAVMDTTAQAALGLTGARSALAVYRTPDGRLLDACAGEDESSLAGEHFRVQKGGVYQGLLEHPATLRLNREQLLDAPEWWGVPEGHLPLEDLLGTSLTDGTGESFGMLLVTGKQGGEFSIQDEYLLAQLAYQASLALQNLQGAARALAQASELDAVFLSTTDALIVYNRQGHVLRANPAAQRLFGGTYPQMNPDGPPTTGGLQLFMPDGSPVDPDLLPNHAALRSGQPTGWIGFHCHLPDGRQIELIASGSPLIDTDGQYSGAVTVWHDITDLEQARRRAEQEANRAGLLAEELNSIFAAMTDSVIVFDLQGNPVRLNPAAREKYGFDVIQTPLEETMTRIHLRKMDGSPFSVEDLPSRRALRGELVLGELSIQVQPDGSDQMILSSAAPVFDSSGRITGSVVIWHNVTEMEQVQLQYQRQRELLERIIEQAPVGIALLEGPEHRYTVANQVMYSISRGKGHLIGRTPADVWPEVAQLFAPILEHISTTGEPYHVENVRLRVERDRGPENASFSMAASPIMNLNGQVESILLMLWETTEEVRNRQQLEQEQAFLKTVIASAPIAIVIADAEGKVITTNPTADRIYQRPAPYGKDYASHTVMEICYSDGSPCDPRDLPLTRSALYGETHRDVELLICWPDGQKRFLVANSAPILGPGKERIGAVGIFDDVTDYRRSVGHDRFLAELGQNLLLQTQPEAIFSMITGELRRHLQVGRVMLNEIDLESGAITVHEDSQEGVPPLPGSFHSNMFPHSLAAGIQEGQAIWSNDVLDDERFEDVGEELARYGFRALVLLPRRKNAQSVQSLDISSPSPRRWMEDEIDLIGSVADLAWLALERARLLQDLQVSEYRYRRLFESNIIGVTYSYLDGKVVEANDAFLALTGYTRQDLASGGIDWRSLTPPEYLALDSQAVAESMERGFCTPFEKEYLRKDGTRIPVMIGFSPLDETATQFVCFVLDMSEQKRYRDALRETQKRLDLALRGSPVVMFTQDTQLRYTWNFNPHPAFGPQNVVGRTEEELLDPRDMPALAAIKRQVMATRQGQRQDVTLHVDDSIVIFDLTVEPQINDRDEVIGVVCVAVDVTERYRLEGEMRHKAAQVEVQRTILQHREQERMKIARDLHDGLLQELVGISFGMGEISLMDDPEKRQARLKQMRASMNAQIEDLRNFCTDLRPPALAPFGVEKALRSFMNTYQERNPGLQVHLNLMHDGNLLNDVIRLTVFRICQELLNNTAKHAQASQVWVSFQLNPERVDLEVRDDGQGFRPPDRWIYLAREGHFGLVGIQERVEAVNGRMEVDAAPGRGTRVAVSIPLRNNPAIEGKIEL